MNREQAKALLPIIAAFADGKEIQRVCGPPTCGWEDTEQINAFNTSYRIKPPPTYRPWASGEIPAYFIAQRRANLRSAVQREARIAVRQIGYDHVRFLCDDGLAGNERIDAEELLNHWERVAEDGSTSFCGVLVP